jgi:hypothetical protein
MKIAVQMEDYPHLLDLANNDKEKFLQLFKATFTMLDQAAEQKHLEASETFFGMPYQEFMKDILTAFFDHAGIMSFHPNKATGEALSDLYGHAVNPLHAALMETDLLDAEGNKISFIEKFGINENDMDIKTWLQGLLFYSYYCSLTDLAKYLALKDYDLVDEEKHKNIAKLLQIKPALAYQKQIGVLPGKLIPLTGFFDCEDSKGESLCPACQTEELQRLGNLKVCNHCYAGFTE